MFGKLDKTVGLVSRLQIKQKKYVNKTKKNNHHRIPFLFDFKQTRSQSNISTPPPSVSRLCFRSRPCTCNTQVYMYTHTHIHTSTPKWRRHRSASALVRLYQATATTWWEKKKVQLGFSAKDQDYYVCYGFNTSGGIYALYICVCVYPI